MRERRPYSVYIMAGRSGVLYIGITSDLECRVRKHKTGVYDGFTKKYKCHRLVNYEQYNSVYAAIGREKQLKGRTRAKKLALNESMNPRWGGPKRVLGTRVSRSRTIREGSRRSPGTTHQTAIRRFVPKEPPDGN
jgi:putative endonuclease